MEAEEKEAREVKESGERVQSLEGGREKEFSQNNKRERNKTCDLSGFLPPRVCLHLACDQTHDQALCLLWGGKIFLSDL